MSDTCETMRIKPSHESQGEFVEINVEDFDPKVHEPLDDLDHDGDGHKGGSLTKAEIMADLDALGIEYDARASKAKLDALLREGKPAREAGINERAEAEGIAVEE